MNTDLDNPNARQRTVADWVSATFGAAVMVDTRERAMRVLEEAIELAQAEGITPEEAAALVGHVYAKPPGEIPQEIGGLRVTILAYSAARALSADECERNEVERILAVDPAEFRARQQAKADAGVAAAPMGSPKYSEVKP